jgi:hypothetical protein
MEQNDGGSVPEKKLKHLPKVRRIRLITVTLRICALSVDSGIYLRFHGFSLSGRVCTKIP